MNGLTVLARIKSGQEEPLRDLLTQIDQAKATNPYINFPEYRLTHGSRWSIIYDEENGFRLLFVTEFDGYFEDFVRELAVTTPGMDAIWGKCEGYEGSARFEEFVRKYGLETQAFYIAFADETVKSIRAKITVRRRLEELLNLNYPWMRPFFDMLSRVPQSIGLWGWIKKRVAVWREVIQRWWIDLLLSIVKPIAQIGIDQNFSRVSSVCGPGQRARVAAPMGEFNCQMITIPEVRPGFFRYWWLRLALCVNQYLGLIWPPGLFADVGTLWSFRWVLIDNNKRIIFLSVFDGTWQNYMGDFIDKIVWALDGIYVNTKNYPPGGMAQIDAFKGFIVTHQFEPQILFRAYPTETVMNLIRDRKVNDTLGNDILKKLNISSEAVAEVLETL